MAMAGDICTSLEERGQFHEKFQQDSALIVRSAFDESAMRLIEQVYAEILENPGPLAQRLYGTSGGTFIQATGDSSQKPGFQTLFRETPILDIVTGIFASEDVWYFEEQLFFKEGDNGPARRTPWHQDTPYHPMNGEKIVVLWIPLNDIDDSAALEVIRGSHRGTLYNGSFFDASDDTLPVYSEEDMPRLPDIENNRENWDIVTCAMKRGDVLAFHTSTLHGGGATAVGERRCSLSLRMVGDDVVRVTRPEINADSPVSNNVGESEIQFQSRLNRVALGQPIYGCGLTKLSR